MTWRPLAVAAAVTVLLVGATACGGDDEVTFERCTSPKLELSVEGTPNDAARAQPSVAVGSTIRVVGSSFVAACDRRRSASVAREPLSGIRLSIVQDGGRVSVARVDAKGDDASFDQLIGIPTILHPGPADVIATADRTDAPPISSSPFTVTAG